jgi:hypothetical protein
MPKLKSALDAAAETFASEQPTPAAPSEADKITLEMERAEREFRQRTEQLRAAGMELGERRRPACEAVDRLRRLAELVINGRRFLTATQARADTIKEAVIQQLGGGVTDIALLHNLEQNDPPAATCERLAGIVAPWLEAREQELSAAITEAKRLVEAAPDNKPMRDDLEQIVASLA